MNKHCLDKFWTNFLQNFTKTNYLKVPQSICNMCQYLRIAIYYVIRKWWMMKYLYILFLQEKLQKLLKIYSPPRL